MDATGWQTIREQIGNKALVMIGASRFLGTEHGIQFKVCRGPLGIVCLSVELDGDDLYTVRAYKRAGRLAGEAEHVFCDRLTATIRDLTGHEVSL